MNIAKVFVLILLVGVLLTSVESKGGGRAAIGGASGARARGSSGSARRGGRGSSRGSRGVSHSAAANEGAESRKSSVLVKPRLVRKKEREQSMKESRDPYKPKPAPKPKSKLEEAAW